MPFTVYDYRTDVRNVLVTPQIRSRFLRMEPGQVANLHSHDLGHEIFLILAGRAEFQIDGDTKELGPGQMCIARLDEPHTVRVVGDEPMTMYLSVTPHIQPTHTSRTPDGGRLPHHYAPASAYDVEVDRSISTEALVDKSVAAAQAVAEAAQACARTQQERAAQLKQALANGDAVAAAEARGAMFDALYATFQRLYDLGDVWNELAPRCTQS
jgi:quercetin dioxygenase-like cupin family protein